MSDANFNRAALSYPARAASIDVRGNQPGLFPFDAFEFDDPNTNENPILKMKSPWSLEAGGITIGGIGLDALSDQLLTGIETAMQRSELNETRIANHDGQLNISAQSITLQAEDISLLTTSVDGNTADIVVNGDEIDLRVKSLDPVTGLPASTSGIKVNASGVLIGNTLQSSNFITGTSGWQIEEDGDAEFESVAVRVGTNSEGVKTLADVATITDDELLVKAGKIRFQSPNYTTETSAIEYTADVGDTYEGFKIGDFDNVDPTKNFGILTTNKGTSLTKGLLVKASKFFNSANTYGELSIYIANNLLYGSALSRGGGAEEAVLCGFGKYQTSGPNIYPMIQSYGLLTYGYLDSILGYSFKAFWGTSFTIPDGSSTLLPTTRQIVFL